MLRTQVRPAASADTDALRDLLTGLSTESAYRRFHAGLGPPSARMLTALLRRDASHGAWVATSGGRLVGHAVWGVEDGAAEIGVVVADAWQRQGIGRSLTRAAAAEARGRGLREVCLHVHADNRELVARLSRHASAAVVSHGVVTISRPLADLVEPPPSRASWPDQVLKVFWARSRPWVTSASTASAARSTS